MITPRMAQVASLLLCSISVASASSRGVDETVDPEPVTLAHEMTTFTIERHIHGRSGVTFRDDTGAPCEIIYNIAGYLATITAGSEEYKIIYHDNGDMVDVERRDEGSGVRRLKHGKEVYLEIEPQSIGVERRHEAVTCRDCEKGWNTVCGVGLASFCELKQGYWAVFGLLARSAIKTMCGTFSRACRVHSARAVCLERCKVDDGGDKYEGQSGGGGGGGGGVGGDSSGGGMNGEDDDDAIGTNDDKDEEDARDDQLDGGDMDGNNKGGPDDVSGKDEVVDRIPDPGPVTLAHQNTTFTLERYIHGRSGVAFRDDTDAQCEIIYNVAGYFATIAAGSEEYKIMYQDDGDMVDVERRDGGSGVRRLQRGEEDHVEDVPQSIGVDKRHEAMTCKACKKGLGTVCGAGLVSFCELRKEYDAVFGPLARSAVKTMCGIFSRACGVNSAVDVCVERCDGENDRDGSDGAGDGRESGDDEDDIGGSDDQNKGGKGDDRTNDGDANGNKKRRPDDATESDDVEKDEDGDDDGSSVEDDGVIACPGCGFNTTCDGATCRCLDGYQGDELVACFDPCNPNPCLDGGFCYVDPGGGHICSCAHGYGGMACQTQTAGLLGFYIVLEFLGDASDWTEKRRTTFTTAAHRWEEVVINQRCPLGAPYFPGRLLISATLEYIDGPDKTLAEAGPTRTWTICPMSSTAGGMRFDTADVEILENTGNFDSVVLHEMGHVIGIGTLWGNCSRCYEELDPDWKCPGTISAYNDLLGNPGGSAANILEVSGRTGNNNWQRHSCVLCSGAVYRSVAVGTTCGHFSEQIFGDELSSGMIKTDIINVVAPLSKITAASLDDTGYVVNAAGVDGYTLPSRRSRRATAETAATDGDVALYSMRRVAVQSTIQLVGDDGEVVGETSGIQINLYGS